MHFVLLIFKVSLFMLNQSFHLTVSSETVSISMFKLSPEQKTVVLSAKCTYLRMSEEITGVVYK